MKIIGVGLFYVGDNRKLELPIIAYPEIEAKLIDLYATNRDNEEHQEAICKLWDTIDILVAGIMTEDNKNKLYDELWALKAKRGITVLKLDIDYEPENNQVDFTYIVSSLKDESPVLKLLQNGQHIYRVDYEKSNVSYTIMRVCYHKNNNTKENKEISEGIYYVVESDSLKVNESEQKEVGLLKYSLIDRYFWYSSAELAHDAYKDGEFKEPLVINDEICF